jgi:hypothetical protein
MDLATIIDCPMCAAFVVLVGLFAPKLAPFVTPLLAKLFNRKPSPVPTPNDPAPQPSRPILDGLLKLLVAKAKLRFPNLSEADAIERYETQERYYHLLEKEKAAKKKATDSSNIC